MEGAGAVPEDGGPESCLRDSRSAKGAKPAHQNEGPGVAGALQEHRRGTGPGRTVGVEGREGGAPGLPWGACAMGGGGREEGVLALWGVGMAGGGGGGREEGRQAHLGVFAPHMSAHGGPGGHLGATQLAALCFHLVVGELHVLLQHVLGDILLVTHRACPLLAHFTCACTEGGREGAGQQWGQPLIPQPPS
jgi:hypothetical protein